MKRTPRKRHYAFPGRLRRHPVVTVLLLVFALIAVYERIQPKGHPVGEDYERYHNQVCRVVRVVDGDTFDVDIPDSDRDVTRIRLWGVDTPEIAGSPKGPMYYGEQASAFTKQFLENPSVRLLLDKKRTRGKYGRLLAYVYSESGDCLNELLVQTGHAYADHRFSHSHRDRYLAMEKDARRNGRGLWEAVTPDQLPGWKKK